MRKISSWTIISVTGTSWNTSELYWRCGSPAVSKLSHKWERYFLCVSPSNNLQGRAGWAESMCVTDLFYNIIKRKRIKLKPASLLFKPLWDLYEREVRRWPSLQLFQQSLQTLASSTAGYQKESKHSSLFPADGRNSRLWTIYTSATWSLRSLTLHQKHGHCWGWTCTSTPTSKYNNNQV